MNCDSSTDTMPATKRKLLDASIALMMQQGYSATTVDQVCAEAGVTKGSFFHYFKSKEEIGRASMDLFTCCQNDAFAEVGLQQIEDPIDRLHLLFDSMSQMVANPDTPNTCLVGMMAQELAESNDNVRSCCCGHFSDWVTMVTGMLKDAKKAVGKQARFDPESVAWMTLSLLQGSMLIGKTKQDRNVMLDNIKHCRTYIDTLLGVSG